MRTKPTACGNERHKLSNVNIEEKKGVCSICGITRIHFKRNKGKIAQFTCLNKRKKDQAKNKMKSRQPYRVNFELSSCSRCGFIPEDSCQLDVDHINQNHDDDTPSNLQTLCANCHRLKSKLAKLGLPFPVFTIQSK